MAEHEHQPPIDTPDATKATIRIDLTKVITPLMLARCERLRTKLQSVNHLDSIELAGDCDALRDLVRAGQLVLDLIKEEATRAS